MSRGRQQGPVALPPWARTKGLGTNAKTDFDRWIREDEVLKLLEAARNGTERWASLAYAALVLMTNLGLRVGEVVQLRASDFDSIDSHNAVNTRTLKKRRFKAISTKEVLRMTPADLEKFQQQVNARVTSKAVIHTTFIGDLEKRGLIPVVAERIREVQGDERDPLLFPHSKRYIQYLFDFYRVRARLRVGLSPHSLRRFAATRIVDLTGDPRMAKKRLRHAEDVTMEHYVQYSPEKQIKLLAKVRPVL